MFAISSGIENLLIISAAGVLGAIILGIGRAVMKVLQTRQARSRNDDFDQRTLSEFFFDTPRDQRTGAPAKEGWTTKVDRTLEQLAQGQTRQAGLLNEVLREIKPDGNGGHNFRGVVERAAAAADVETEKQTTERDRVQLRDNNA